MDKVFDIDKSQLIDLNLKNCIILKETFYGNFHTKDINNLFNKSEQLKLFHNIYLSNKDWNEVLLSNSRKRIYFDLDKTYTTKIDLINNINKIIPQFDKNLKEFLMDLSNSMKISNNFEIIYSDASGYNKKENNYKLSFHIIVSGFGTIIDSEKLKYIICLFLEKFSIYKDFVDTSVYNDYKLFRVNYSISPKDGKQRRLKVIKKGYQTTYINYKDIICNNNFWNLFVVDYQSNELILDNMINIPQYKKTSKSNKSKNVDNNIDFNILAKIVNKIKDDYNIPKQ